MIEESWFNTRQEEQICLFSKKNIPIAAGSQPAIQRVTDTYLPSLNNKRIGFNGIKLREPHENHAKVS
jgi:hypothetical protein